MRRRKRNAINEAETEGYVRMKTRTVVTMGSNAVRKLRGRPGAFPKLFVLPYLYICVFLSQFLKIPALYCLIRVVVGLVSQ